MSGLFHPRYTGTDFGPLTRGLIERGIGKHARETGDEVRRIIGELFFSTPKEVTMPDEQNQNQAQAPQPESQTQDQASAQPAKNEPADPVVDGIARMGLTAAAAAKFSTLRALIDRLEHSVSIEAHQLAADFHSDVVKAVDDLKVHFKQDLSS